MPVSGLNASFKLGATTYDSDDCIQGWDLDDALNDIVYQCTQFNKHIVGARTVVFSGTLALDATDTTKINALKAGTQGAFEGHPAGDTATYMEIISTQGTVTRSHMSAPINGVITLDFDIALDDVTYQAAT
jgi:hypothetical protein